MAETTGFPPVPLLSNSYDLQELEKAALHAESLEGDERDAAFAKLPYDQALNQNALEALAAPAVPEGAELAEVEDALGRKVVAPVALIDEAAAQENTGTTSRRRKASDDTNQGAAA